MAQFIGELFGKPEIVLRVNIQAIMRMTIGCGSVIERKCSRTFVKRAQDTLQGIGKPDLTILIDCNAGSVHPTARTGRMVEVFSDALCGTRSRGRNHELTNRTGPAFRPPDIAAGISRNQVRSETTG